MRRLGVLVGLLILFGYALYGCGAEQKIVFPERGDEDIGLETSDTEEIPDFECIGEKGKTPICGNECSSLCGCQACEPGEGFCSDDSKFAYICSDSGDCYMQIDCSSRGLHCKEVADNMAACIGDSDGDLDDFELDSAEEFEENDTEFDENYEPDEFVDEYELESVDVLSDEEPVEEEFFDEEEVQPAYGAIVGCARYFNRASSAGIKIVLLDSDTQQEVLQANVDDDCSFEMTDVPIGLYTLRAKADGYVPVDIPNVPVFDGSRYDTGEITLRYTELVQEGAVGHWLRFSLDRQKLLFFVDTESLYGTLMAVDTGDISSVVELAQDVYVNNINLLRGGDGLLYFSPFDAQARTGSLWRVMFDSAGRPQRLLENIYTSYTYDITHDTLLYFTGYDELYQTANLHSFSLVDASSSLLGEDVGVGIFLLSGLDGVLYMKPTDNSIHSAQMYFVKYGQNATLVDSSVYRFTQGFAPDGHHIAYYKVSNSELYGTLSIKDLSVINAEPITVAEDAFVQYVRFAQDGSRVFFWRNVNYTIADLYERQLNANMQPIGDELLLQSQFFRYLHKFIDSESCILLFANRSQNGEDFDLIEVSFDGSSSRLLASNVSNTMLRTAGPNRYVFVLDGESGGYDMDLLRIDRTTGERIVAAERIHSAYVSISSDGNRVFFYRDFDPSTGAGKWFVKDISTGTEQLLGEGVHFSFNFVGGGSGSALFVANLSDGIGDLLYFDADSGTISAIATNVAPGNYRMIDSNRILVIRLGKLYLAYLDGSEPLLISDKAPDSMSSIAYFDEHKLFMVIADNGYPYDLVPGLYLLHIPQQPED